MPQFQAVYSPEALQEIKRIIEWYSESSKGLGSRFKKSLLTEMENIKRNPFTKSFRYDKVRLAVIKKFPYAIHYTVDESEHFIKVQAVLGFAQDSDNWKIRF